MPEPVKDNANLNLPIRLTKFFGRETEKSHATELFLTGQLRLLNLTGVGGVGKTRLSLEIATALAPHFKDGAWFIELAPLTDFSLLPDTIAATLAIQPGQQKGRLEILVDYLANKQLLLVLDNCEHLVDGVARLAAQLLSNCPGLAILTTSRESLGLEGEQVLRVSPLETPPLLAGDKAILINQDFAGYEAVQLFVERARAVNPEFWLTPQNSPAVAEICARLDGIPLSLELAAARINVLSPEAIALRLKDSFRLLTGGFRTALPRHKTLRASIDWSYNLLSPAEQVLLRRISVLPGGCSLAAAEFVGAGIYPGGEIEAMDVLDLLDQLINKSLLQFQKQAEVEAEPRYMMLETIRQYAGEKLVETGEQALVWQKCCEWVQTLTEIINPALYTARREEAVRQIEKDYDNLRAVLGWLQVAHMTVTGTTYGPTEFRQKIGSALGYFWYLAGYWSEGYNYIEQILEQLDAGVSHKTERAKLLLDAGILAYFLGDFGASETRLRESIGLWKELGVSRYQVLGLSTLGNLGLNRGKLQDAQPVFDTLEALLKTWKEEINVIWVEAERSLGWWFLRQEKFEQAGVQFEKCLDAGRQMQDKLFIARAFRDLGVLALASNNFGKANYWLKQSLQISVEIKNKQYVPDLLVNLAELSRKERDFSQAAAYLEEGLRICREISYKSSQVVTTHNLGLTLLCLEKYDQAEVYLKESLLSARELDNKKLVILALAGIASVKAMAGSLRVAACLFGVAENLRQVRGFIIGDTDSQVHEFALAQLKAQLDKSVLEHAWKQGQTLSLDNAVDFALAPRENQESFISVAQIPVEPEMVVRPVLPAESPQPADNKRPLLNADNFPVNLTERELEVLILLSEGLTNSQIADSLVLSPRTVHAHVRSILGKIGVNSRSAATRFALKNGLA